MLTIDEIEEALARIEASDSAFLKRIALDEADGDEREAERMICEARQIVEDAVQVPAIADCIRRVARELLAHGSLSGAEVHAIVEPLLEEA